MRARKRVWSRFILLSGVKLSGRIKSFDKYFSLCSKTNNQEQLIFKHAISTVVIARTVPLHTSATASSHQTTGTPLTQAIGATTTHSEG